MRIAAFPSHLESNPYCDLLYDNLRELGVELAEGIEPSFRDFWRHRGEVEVLHFHWIERYYRHWRGGWFSRLTLLRFKLLILFARALGYRIVWTMHNLRPHESSDGRLDDEAARFMAEHASTAVHCERARELLEERAGRVRTAVIPHGNYIGCYPARHTRESARKELGIPQAGMVFLYFGMIRMYKGIDELCRAFSAAGAEDAMLLVAGKPYEDEEADFIDRVKEDYAESGIRFDCAFIPDDEVAKYFIACDFAVFPYRNVLTSGSIVLAMGFARPVIAPRIGCIAELEDEGVGIFYDPEEEGGLERAVREALRTQDAVGMAERAERYARKLDWRSIAEDYLSLYRQGG